MVGSRAFACVLHEGAERRRRSSFRVSSRDWSQASSHVASQALRAVASLDSCLEAAIVSEVVTTTALVAMPHREAVLATCHAPLWSTIVGDDQCVLDAEAGAGLAHGGDAAHHGDADRGAPDEVDSGATAEAPRRLRSLGLAAFRAPRPRVAQRLERGIGSSLYGASPRPSRKEARRDHAGLPAHLHNLLRSDLSAVGFSGYLPNAEALAAVVDTPSAPATVATPDAALELPAVADHDTPTIDVELPAVADLGTPTIEAQISKRRRNYAGETCKYCRHSFELDWLACPTCGALAMSARPRRPSVTRVAAPAAGVPEAALRTGRVVRPVLARQALVPSASPALAPVARERGTERASATWTYVIGGVVLVALVLFLLGVL